jgi:alkylation response protein AidB-like acyl-CoA dehydrogenase
MDFDYTDEQKQFAESVRRFAQAHIAAGALKQHLKDTYTQLRQLSDRKR